MVATETSVDSMNFTLTGGFWPGSPLLGPPDRVIAGSGVWFRSNGKWVSDTGTTAVLSLGASLTTLQVVGSTHGGTTAGGNIVEHSTTQFFTGNAYKGGTNLGNVGTTLSLMVSGSAVAVGLAAPGAATIDGAGSAFANFSGSYSIRIGAYRSTTGAYSSVGPVSNVVAVDGTKIRITAWPTAVTGQTHFVIYASRRGFGSIGPWYKYQIVINASATANYEISWFDGELTDLQPLDYDPPPASTHVAALGGCLIALTATGGVYPSIVGKPEAFPPGYVTWLAAREAITGVTSRGADGVVYVATANSFSALILSGSDVTPILPRGIWSDTGFAGFNSWCIVDGEIYGFSGKRGFVRTQGSDAPDTSFALPVQEFAAANGFTSANTKVCFAPDHDAVLFASGTNVLAYMRASGVWSLPIPLPGTATGALRLAEVGYITIGASGYSLDSGGAGGSWSMTTCHVAVDGFRRKMVRYAIPSATANIVIDLQKNLTTSSIGSPFPYTMTAQPIEPAIRCAQKGIESIALKVSGSTGGQTFNALELQLWTDPLYV